MAMPQPDGPQFLPRLNKKQHKLRQEALVRGPDYVRNLHQTAIYDSGVSDVLDNHPRFETITANDVLAVSKRIQEESRQALRQAGFSDIIPVWRSEYADVGKKIDRVNRVVPVTIKEGGLKDFRKPHNVTRAYNIRLDDVLSQFVVGPYKRWITDEGEIQVEEGRLMPRDLGEK